MPYINIQIGKKLSKEQEKKLFQQTTEFMNSVMGKRKEVTVVRTQQSSSQHWSVNSKALTGTDPIAAYVDIKITKGTNTSAEKSEMITKVVQMLQSIVGATQEACYVVIDEIPASSWGYNGITQHKRSTFTRSEI